MRAVTSPQLTRLMQKAFIKTRLRKEVRFRPAEVVSWEDTELLAIPDRSGNQGVLLVQPYDELYVVSYEISRGLSDNQSGRFKPAICDLCYTWQQGSNMAGITFDLPDTVLHTVSYLCCADLECSKNARLKTEASIMSRVQLHERMTAGQRTDRLKARLLKLMDRLDRKPVVD